MDSAAINITHLELMHKQVTKKDGLLDFTKKLRLPGEARLNTAEKVKVSELMTRFGNNPLWKNLPTGNGHVNFQNRLFKQIHIGFLAHGSTEVYGEHLEKILDNVQRLINILCDEVYKTPNINWTDKPDYQASFLRYQQLVRQA